MCAAVNSLPPFLSHAPMRADALAPQAALMFKRIDTSKDGKLDFDEFIKVIKPHLTNIIAARESMNKISARELTSVLPARAALHEPIEIEE